MGVLSSAAMDPIDRHASRIVVPGDRDRMLLFRVERVSIKSAVDRTRRQLHPCERQGRRHAANCGTGQASRPNPVVCVWLRRPLLRFPGRLVDEAERFFVVRVSDDCHREELERQFLVERYRWICEETAVTPDYFASRRMRELLPPIVAGNYPAEPVDTCV
jgi:hypothetical protein